MTGFFGMVKRKKLSALGALITDMIIDKWTSVSATQYSK